MTWFYLNLDTGELMQCWINFRDSFGADDFDQRRSLRMSAVARELVDYNAIVRKKSKSGRFFIRFNSEADAVAFMLKWS